MAKPRLSTPAEINLSSLSSSRTPCCSRMRNSCKFAPRADLADPERQNTRPRCQCRREAAKAPTTCWRSFSFVLETLPYPTHGDSSAQLRSCYVALTFHDSFWYLVERERFVWAGSRFSALADSCRLILFCCIVALSYARTCTDVISRPRMTPPIALRSLLQKNQSKPVAVQTMERKPTGRASASGRNDTSRKCHRLT